MSCLTFEAFPYPRAYQPPVPTAFEDEHVDFTVERILDHRERPSRGKSRREYLVKMLEYGTEHNKFDPNCGNCSC